MVHTTTLQFVLSTGIDSPPRGIGEDAGDETDERGSGYN